jgi:tripartite-type tricarboxylate transporter receptor subunit TctC
MTIAKLSLRLLIAVLAAFAMTAANAQAYPTKPIRIIVPFAPGGSADMLARLMAQEMAPSFGESILVENRTGAAGNIGTSFVAKSEPDGHTLLLAFDGTLAINPSIYKSLPFDTLRDFAPITLLARVPIVLVAHPSFPPDNVRELIAYAKQHPGIDYATAGLGSTTHLAIVLLEQRTGTKFTHIAYKGGAQGAIDVLAGQVPLLSQGLPGAQPHIKSGKLKAIGITTAKRHPSLPNVGSFAEAGVPDYDVSLWFGLMAPAGTPKAVIGRLHAEAAKILSAQEMRTRFQTKIGADAVGNTPDEFSAEIKKDLERWAQIVRQSGLSIQ